MKKNNYFEPPSRLQLLDKLKHFVRFSDFLLLVSGERGAGKSILLSQLQPEAEDTTFCCGFIRPESEVNEQKLLELLMKQFPSHEQAGNSYADQLKLFHLQLKSMQAVGQKCLIAIDDAEFLSEGALALLFNLHVADAQVLLASENDFARSLLELDAVKHMEGRVHHLMIEGMTDAETAEYLELCHPAISTLPEKKKTELIRLSSGMPGRIETLLAGGKVAMSPSTEKQSAFPLPAIHMTGIASVLVAIVGVSLWQFIPEEDVEPVEVVSESRVSLPLSVGVTVSDGITSNDKDKPSEIVVVTNERANPVKEIATEGPVVDPAKKDLAQRLLAQEAKISSDKEGKEVESRASALEDELREVVQAVPVSESKRMAIAEEIDVVVSKSIEPVVEQPPSVAVVKPKPKKSIPAVKIANDGSEGLLLSWPSAGYTLQMSGARSKDSALDFIASQPNSSEFYHFETVYKGLPWHVVVHGQYANRDIANASIRKLPKSLQKVKPWARSVQGVQIDIRKKKTN